MAADDRQRLRGRRRNAADPLNLIRIMPAKGATGVAATDPSNAFRKNDGSELLDDLLSTINSQLSIDL